MKTVGNSIASEEYALKMCRRMAVWFEGLNPEGASRCRMKALLTAFAD
jgi:hypothetical protein